MKLKKEYAEILENLEDQEAKEIILKALEKKYWIDFTVLEAGKMCNYLSKNEMSLINLLKILEP